MIARTFDRALEAAGEKEAAPGGETVFAGNKKYNPDRDRALMPGEMKNEFEKALSVSEWADYYDGLKAPGYNVDLFGGKERTYMMRGNKVLLMEMQKNGEFSVIGVYRSRYGWYDVGIETVLEGWEEQEYGQEKIESWLASFAAHDGPALFERYDRHGGRFVRLDGKENRIGRGAAGVSGGRDAHGAGVREDAVGQEQGDGSVEKTVSLSLMTAKSRTPAAQEMMYSLRTLPETDYIKERDKAAAALAKRMGIEARDIHGATSSK